MKVTLPQTDRRCTARLAVLAVMLATCLVTSASADPPVTDVAFSPDGKSVVACSQAGLNVYAWPELTFQRTIKSTAPNLHAIVFSPSGDWLALAGGSPSENGTVEVLSWPEGDSLKLLDEHADSADKIQNIFQDTRSQSFSKISEIFLKFQYNIII